MTALKKLTYTHEAMIDLILQDPTVKTAELAEVFGLTPGWVARVVASDSFQSRLAQRKAGLIDPIIARSLNERIRSVAIRSMDIIEDKLDKEASAEYAMNALQFSAQSLQLLSNRADHLDKVVKL